MGEGQPDPMRGSQGDTPSVRVLLGTGWGGGDWRGSQQWLHCTDGQMAGEVAARALQQWPDCTEGWPAWAIGHMIPPCSMAPATLTDAPSLAISEH